MNLVIAGRCCQANNKEIMKNMTRDLGEYEEITDINERVFVSVTYDIY